MYPLSPNQEALMAAESQGLSPSHLLLALKPRKDIEADRLEAAVNQIARHHLVLSARIDRSAVSEMEWRIGMQTYSGTGMLTPGLFQQSIQRDSRVSVQRIETNAGSFASVVSRFVNELFDLRGQGPMRGLLLKLQREVVLLLDFHHVACDSRSLRIIHGELARILSGNERPTYELPLQYHDYAIWQKERARSGYFQPSIEYWRKQTATFGKETGVNLADLPFCVPDQMRPRGPAAAESMALNLHATSAEIPALILAAWFAFLHLNTGRQKIALWQMFPNRSLPGTDQLVGYFAHMHAVGVSFRQDIKARELLANVCAAASEAERHSQVHNSLLWRKLGKAHRLGDAGLVFNVVDETNPEPLTGCLERLALPHVEGIRAQAGLHLTVIKRDAGYILQSHYSPHHFRSDAIQEMLGDVARIAAEMMEEPERAISLLTRKAAA
jgi:hypothetical protein